MRHRSTNPTVPQTPADRLLELKLRIWGTVAVNLLNKEENPYVIPASKIESHGGRIGKAIKDLGGLVSPARSKDSSRAYQVHDFETQSADLAVAPTFISTWQECHDEMFSKRYGINSQSDFDLVGYQIVENLSRTGVLYVYWHQDEYDIAIADDSVYVYPIALRETHIKAMLRAIVESHYNDDYITKLEHYLSIPEGSLKRNDTYEIEVRNFSARAADLSHDRFYGTNGFQEEYAHHREYLDALLHNLSKLDALIQSKGGYEHIHREMRKASMVELLERAPLHINYEDDEINSTPIGTEKYKVYKSKYPSTYLLRHSAYFDYDTLYGTDESVTYIDGGSAVENSYSAKDHEYTPDEDEAHIIEAYRKDTACSVKNTSGVLQPTY